MEDILRIALALISRDEYKIHGLCDLLYSAAKDGRITYRQYSDFKSYLKQNKPKLTIYNALFNGVISNEDYYWRVGKKKHRIKWLKKQIAILSSKN